MAGWEKTARRARRFAARNFHALLATAIVLVALASSLLILFARSPPDAAPELPVFSQTNLPSAKLVPISNATAPVRAGSQVFVLPAEGSPLPALASAGTALGQALETLEKDSALAADTGIAIRFRSAQRLFAGEIAPLIALLRELEAANDPLLDEETMRLAIALDAEEHLLAKLAAYAEGRAPDDLKNRVAAAESAARALAALYANAYRGYLAQERGIIIPETEQLLHGSADADSDEDGVSDSSDQDDDGDGVPDAEDFSVGVYDEFLDDRYGVH